MSMKRRKLCARCWPTKQRGVKGLTKCTGKKAKGEPEFKEGEEQSDNRWQWTGPVGSNGWKVLGT
jgi:hypothetical protein